MTCFTANMFPGEFRDKIFDAQDGGDDDGANRNVGSNMDSFLTDGAQKDKEKTPLADLLYVDYLYFSNAATNYPCS